MTTTQALEDAPEFKLLDALFRSDADAAAALFAGPAVVDAPWVGRVEGDAGLRDLAGRWPSMFNVDPGRRLAPRGRIVEGPRAVSETWAEVRGADGRPLRLPIAISADLAPDGRLREARLYHYMKAVTGEPGSRPSPFRARPDDRPGRAEDLPDVNADYFRAVSTFDVEMMLGLFAEDAYMESGTWRFQSRPQLRKVYEHFLTGEQMVLLFSAMTYDGESFALEWSAGHLAVRESGLTVYQRNAANKLVAVRMYDFFDLNDIPGLSPTWIGSGS